VKVAECLGYCRVKYREGGDERKGEKTRHMSKDLEKSSGKMWRKNGIEVPEYRHENGKQKLSSVDDFKRVKRGS